MTADDTVTIPRELAERIYSDMAFGAAANELAAILNPPPEFDPEMVEAMAAGLEEVIAGLTLRRERAVTVLTAARSAGWEVVQADELAALHQLVDEAYGWPDDEKGTCTVGRNGDFFFPQRLVNAIRKAKAAQR